MMVTLVAFWSPQAFFLDGIKLDKRGKSPSSHLSKLQHLCLFYSSFEEKGHKITRSDGLTMLLNIGI